MDMKKILEDCNFRDHILRKDKETLAKIGLFVLLLGKLEYQIKGLIFMRNPKVNMENETLGIIINELEKQLSEIKNEYDKNTKDYRLRNFLTEKNVKEFIDQCKCLNKLRIDLVHAFVSPEKSNCKSSSDILAEVDKLLIGSDNWDAYRHGRISQEVLKGEETTDPLVDEKLHIRTHEGNIRDALPIYGLIEICNIFYKIIKQLGKQICPQPTT